jgi:sortase A
VNALRVAARGLGELLITLGLVLLLFLVWQLWWTDVAAGRTQTQETRDLRQSWAPTPAPSAPAATPSPSPSATPRVVDVAPLKLHAGKAFALLHVPRFGHDYVRPVIEGVDVDVLDRGVGHYPDSADPGAVGNFAVAGHRVTYGKPFNRIAELRPGDPVVVETAKAWFVYRVVSHVVVTPEHVEVIAPVPQHPGAKPTRRMMTMTACHPQFSARERYVVFSELETSVPKTPGFVPDVLK